MSVSLLPSINLERVNGGVNLVIMNGSESSGSLYDIMSYKNRIQMIVPHMNNGFGSKPFYPQAN